MGTAGFSQTKDEMKRRGVYIAPRRNFILGCRDCRIFWDFDAQEKNNEKGGVLKFGLKWRKMGQNKVLISL